MYFAVDEVYFSSAYGGELSVHSKKCTFLGKMDHLWVIPRSRLADDRYSLLLQLKTTDFSRKTVANVEHSESFRAVDNRSMLGCWHQRADESLGNPLPRGVYPPNTLEQVPPTLPLLPPSPSTPLPLRSPPLPLEVGPLITARGPGGAL